jgi:hypothetical protein
MGRLFEQSSLFFHKFSFIINTFFQLCFSRCVSVVRTSLLKLFTHAVLSARRRQENGVLVVHLSGGQIMEVWGAKCFLLGETREQIQGTDCCGQSDG